MPVFTFTSRSTLQTPPPRDPSTCPRDISPKAPKPCLRRPACAVAIGPSAEMRASLFVRSRCPVMTATLLAPANFATKAEGPRDNTPTPASMGGNRHLPDVNQKAKSVANFWQFVVVKLYHGFLAIQPPSPHMKFLMASSDFLVVPTISPVHVTAKPAEASPSLMRMAFGSPVAFLEAPWISYQVSPTLTAQCVAKSATNTRFPMNTVRCGPVSPEATKLAASRSALACCKDFRLSLATWILSCLRSTLLSGISTSSRPSFSKDPTALDRLSTIPLRRTSPTSGSDCVCLIWSSTFGSSSEAPLNVLMQCNGSAAHTTICCSGSSTSDASSAGSALPAFFSCSAWRASFSASRLACRLACRSALI
mmetsp:Transcript_1946/g.5493  ORF Transcript_1946/g.5493 Transcript_1946/m.5493 type:complete len:365 (+) Transcript_1946:268-1362(+)